MSDVRDRLRDIRKRLDHLMEEVRGLQERIRAGGRDRKYRYPFEHAPAVGRGNVLPKRKTSSR